MFSDHFFNKEWSILPTSGYPVRGGFGHSSVWDDITNRIYVYGGYVSTAPTHAVIGMVTNKMPIVTIFVHKFFKHKFHQ